MPTHKFLGLSSLERRATFSITSLFALRMLGLLLILPVFSLYAQTLQGSTPLLIGIAMGCYGLTQALLQLPFGMWSDRAGRKPVIAIGLTIFVIGSVIAALAHSIIPMIIGRSLQGAGAVGSATSAMLADLTKPENRTKAMAILGVTIGTVFSAAMILGPLFNSWFSASGIFWVSSLLGLLALIILKTWTPTPQKTILHPDVEIVPANLKNILCNSQLLRLNLGVLCLHAILTANFVVLPILLQSHAHLAEKQQWMIYLPSLILAFISMVPIIIWGEKKQNLHSANLFAIGLLAIAETVLYRFTYSAPIMAIGLWLFFTAFTALEATMPSAISKIAPAHSKGTAMGVYSSSQFLGIFLGGSGGGWLYSHFPLPNVLLACILLTIIWFLIMLCDRRE